MKENLELYNQIDWWNPKHSLLQMAPDKFNLNNIEIKGIQFTSANNSGIQIKIGGSKWMSYIGYAQKK